MYKVWEPRGKIGREYGIGDVDNIEFLSSTVRSRNFARLPLLLSILRPPCILLDDLMDSQMTLNL
jgi:hypothetical protein